MAKPAQETAAGRAAWLRRLLPLVLLLAAAALAYSAGWHRLLTLEALADHRDGLKTFVARRELTALAAFMLIYAGAVALSLPGGVLLTVAGGFLFGWVMGGAAAVIAASAGATILFLIARSALGETLAARAGPRLERLRAGFQKDAFNYLLFLRLVPVFPFWLVNLAPALLGVRLSTFVLATIVGIIPGTFAFAFLGVGLDSVIEAQIAAQQACIAELGDAGACPLKLKLYKLATPKLMLALAALGVVALIPVILRKFKARNG